MANLSVNVTPEGRRLPQPPPPANEPRGVLLLYSFFIDLMMKVINGTHMDSTDADTLGALGCGAIGFEEIGAIVPRHSLNTYNELVLRHSYINDLATDEGTAPERALIHVMWLNIVVPRALRAAHRHVQHIVDTSPDMHMVNACGHSFVAKVFMALLDDVISTALDDPVFVRCMREADETLNANHYRATFRRNADPITVFDLTCITTTDMDM